MWRDRIQDESGIALIYALFAVVILGGLAVLFVARSLTESRTTGISRDREAAIHVAEAGAEAYIAAINDEGNTAALRVVTTGDDPATGTTETTWKAVYDPPGALTGRDLESWEIEWATAIARANPSLLVDTGEGEAFGIRPMRSDGTDAEPIVFGVGFVPSFSAWDAGAQRAQARVIKMRINRDFLEPAYALLLDGDLKLGGNASIQAPSCDSTTGAGCVADIHVNGNVDLTGSSHTIEGQLTASGTITGTAQTVPAGRSFAGEEDEKLPSIDPRDFYNRGGTLNPDPTSGTPAQPYDLCPDGTVRTPSSTPCAGPTVWPTGDGSTNFLGWSWRGAQETWEGKTVKSGFFYVYHADADITGSDGLQAVTVIVEANPGDLDDTGSLEITGNPKMVSAMPDVLFIISHDLKMKGSSGGGSNKTCTTATCSDVQNYEGFIWAGEQLDVSGNVVLAGALMAKDAKDDHGLVKRNTAGVSGSMTLDFDPDLKIDTSGIVTIEYWNELD